MRFVSPMREGRSSRWRKSATAFGLASSRARRDIGPATPAARRSTPPSPNVIQIRVGVRCITTIASVWKESGCGTPFARSQDASVHARRALTVALAVGATTAIFSVVHGVLLRELPYRQPSEVFWIWSDQPGRDRTPFNVPDFIDYRDGDTTLSASPASSPRARTSPSSAAERVQGHSRDRKPVRRAGREARGSDVCCSLPTNGPAPITSSSSPNRSGCAGSAPIRPSSAARSGSTANSTRSSA